MIFVQAFGTVYSGLWEWMMYAVIILTITVGNLFAIRQKNMKRFMAFSSISQAGYIMLGVMTESALGLGSMMYYIFVYVVSNLAVFGVISAIENKTGKVGMDDYDGLHKSNPWLSFAMTLAMFSACRYPAVRRILQQIPDLYFGDSFRFDAPLYACAGSVDQYDYIALLLSARGEGHLDQSRRSKGRGIQKCIYRDWHCGSASGNCILRTGALHL